MTYFILRLQAAAALAASFICSTSMAVQAPNVVAIDRNLVTSGQPSDISLSGLKAEGFEAVIYLAPSSVSDAVKDEPTLLE